MKNLRNTHLAQYFIYLPYDGYFLWGANFGSFKVDLAVIKLPCMKINAYYVVDTGRSIYYSASMKIELNIK